MSTSPVKQPPSPFKRQNSLPKRQNSLPKREASMSPMKRRENATPFTVADEDLAPRRGKRGFGILLQMVNISLLAFCVYRLQFSAAVDTRLSATPASAETKLGVSLSSWDIAAASSLNHKPYVPRRFQSCNLDLVRGVSKAGLAPAAWPLCANHVPANATVYSFGTAASASVNIEMIRKGHRVYAFDPAVKPEDAEQSFRPGFERYLPRFSHMQVGLGKDNGVARLPSKTPGQAEAEPEAPVLTLQTLMAALGHDHVDLLKVGSGSAESDICSSQGFLSALSRVGQVLLEVQQDKVGEVQCKALLAEKGLKLVESTPSGQHLLARVSKGGKVFKLARRTFLR